MTNKREESMPLFNRKKILQKMATIRQQFETGTISNELLIDLYSKYNPNIDDMRAFTKSARDLFPSLNCGLASIYLQGVLQQGNIRKGKYKDENHTFLIVKDEIDEMLVADITADQYGGPKVFLGPLQSPWSLSNRM